MLNIGNHQSVLHCPIVRFIGFLPGVLLENPWKLCINRDNCTSSGKSQGVAEENELILKISGPDLRSMICGSPRFSCYLELEKKQGKRNDKKQKTQNPRHFSNHTVSVISLHFFTDLRTVQRSGGFLSQSPWLHVGCADGSVRNEGLRCKAEPNVAEVHHFIAVMYDGNDCYYSYYYMDI